MIDSCSITLNHGGANAAALTHATGVGLFAEDIEPRSGNASWNCLQAYTHVGLMNTAVTISELLEAWDARFRAWS